MPVMVRALVVSTFCMLLLSACPSNPSTTCKDSKGCNSEETCCIEKGKEEGTCVPKGECKNTSCSTAPCSSKSDCRTTEICKEGCCETEPQGPVCQKDADCERGKECGAAGTERRCRSCAKPCDTLSDCSGQDSCNNGCCSLPACTDDAECKDRDSTTPRCNTTTGKCAVCLTNEHCQESNAKSICQDGDCETVECTDDTHCTEGDKTRCDLQTFKCAAKKVCATDAECTDAQLSRCDPNANGGLGACKKGHCIECTSDDECGGSGDFCVGKDKNLKDGSRCLTACKETKDCKDGFLCSENVVSGFKVCFPVAGYCIDPCKNKQCPDKHRCIEGTCVKEPEPCDPCTSDEECGSGNQCLQLGGKFYCGKACTSTSDCPAKGNGFDFLCLNGQCTDQNSCKGS